LARRGITDGGNRNWQIGRLADWRIGRLVDLKGLENSVF
jgi:hypothetical protein